MSKVKKLKEMSLIVQVQFKLEINKLYQYRYIYIQICSNHFNNIYQFFICIGIVKEKLQAIQEPNSYVGDVVKLMGKDKILVKVNPEGKCLVTLDKNIKIEDLKPNTRVALKSDSYVLHKILPTKVDPLVSLMKVEKMPDSTYDMIDGLDQQVKEVKQVIELPIKHPEIFEILGIAQPKGVLLFMAHQEQEKNYWQVLQHIIKIAHLQESVVQNQSKNKLEKVLGWLENCLLWHINILHV